MIMTPLVAVTTILVFFKPTAIAVSNHAHNRVVTQVHLAQGVTSSSMTVSWVTPSSITSSKSPTKKPTVVPHNSDVKSDSVFFRLRQEDIGKKLNRYKKASVDGREILEENHSNEVRYSTVASNMYLSAIGYNTSYTFNYKKEENYTSGYLHHTLLTNLLPSTIYYYQCGDFSTGSDNDVSGVLQFETLPSPGDKKELSFAVLGDLGQTKDSMATVAHIIGSEQLRAVLHAGDLSYGDCVGRLWDSYGEMIEPLSSQIPWMVSPGNHEIEHIFVNKTNAHGITKTESQLYTAFESRYKMPSLKQAEFGEIFVPGFWNHSYGCAPSTFLSDYNYGNSFYSFEAGLVHFLFLNPYTPSNVISKQYQFVKSDLLSVNRANTPWIVVVTHCPFYNSNKGHYNENQTVAMKSNLEDIFYENHVNLVVSGHVHAYERSYPIHKSNVRTDGVTYIGIGDAGNREGHNDLYHARPSWTAYRNGTQYGYGQLKIVDKNSLTWTWHRNIDGNLISADTIEICNSNNLNVDCSNYSKESSKDKKPYTLKQKIFMFFIGVVLYQCLVCIIAGLCFELKNVIKDKYNNRNRGRERTRVVRTTGDNDSIMLFETTYNNINNNDNNIDNENNIEERLTESKESDVSSDDDNSLHPSNDLSIHNTTSSTSLLLPPLSAST